MRRIVICFIICLTVVVGCALKQWLGLDQSTPISIEEYQARCIRYDNPWVGRQRDELIAMRGRPDDIRVAGVRGCELEGRVHLNSYIYSPDTSSDSSCIDAFVILEETGTIVKYYCR